MGNIPFNPADLSGANKDSAHFTLSEVTISRATCEFIFKAWCVVALCSTNVCTVFPEK